MPPTVSISCDAPSMCIIGGGCNKRGVGKMMKIRSDLYFLLLSEAQRRVIVFTQRDMYEQFEKERKAGRVPPDIEYLLADTPDDLKERLEAARWMASEELAPRGGD